jgi:hypothetical protein
VFDLLLARASAGAAAASHVDVIRSTGPGLLRSAVLAIASAAPYQGRGQAPVGKRDVAQGEGDDREQIGGADGWDETLADTRHLDALGIRLLPSAVWHPLLPEQKHGRDASPQTLAQIAASYVPPGPPLSAPTLRSSHSRLCAHRAHRIWLSKRMDLWSPPAPSC